MGDPSKSDVVTDFNSDNEREKRQAARDKANADNAQKELDKLSFGEAFKKKSAELGPNKTFTWRGKSYSTNKAD